MGRGLIILLVMILAASGCETPQTRLAESDVDRTLVAFLQVGTTTRADAIVALGAPSERFENDQVLTYLLRTDDAGELRVVTPPRQSPDGFYDWRSLTFSLVLVFDAHGVLERHSLVRIHG